MLLSKLSCIDRKGQIDILTENGKISSITEYGTIKNTSSDIIDFKDASVFPGLINSHDHLDFNLFPQLGNRNYNNYVEWGEDIHKQNKEVIDAVLKIPKELRVQWGIYKNLINGVTTVVNHGVHLQIDNNLIRVWQSTHVLHSVQLEKRWKLKLNFPFIKSWPFSIHTGEGTDDASYKEIEELLRWNFLKRSLIGIHGIAMREDQASEFKGIVWCPVSNNFLIGRTAEIDKLKNETSILFGTDSTLSASWNIWEHLRLARQKKMLTDDELFESLTVQAAKVWPIPNAGEIKKGFDADIVIGKKKSSLEGMDAFYALNPEDILMVISKGSIRLFDETLLHNLNTMEIDLKSFSKIYINGACKYIAGDLPLLIRKVKEYYSGASFPVTA